MGLRAGDFFGAIVRYKCRELKPFPRMDELNPGLGGRDRFGRDARRSYLLSANGSTWVTTSFT